jgi:hypothetical protein
VLFSKQLKNLIKSKKKKKGGGECWRIKQKKKLKKEKKNHANLSKPLKPRLISQT